MAAVGMMLGSASESPPAPTKRMPSTTARVELEIEPANWWICGAKKELLFTPCGGALAVLNAGMVLSSSSMLVAPDARIASWSSVMTLEPTGAAPRMLVPVTVTSSTGAPAVDALCCCANAGVAKKDTAATNAAREPPIKSSLRNISILIPAFSDFGHATGRLALCQKAGSPKISSHGIVVALQQAGAHGYASRASAIP